MAKVRVKLRHTSYFPGSEGKPGDVVEVDQELANRWLSSRGAVPCEPEPQAVEPKPAPTRAPRSKKES